MIKNIVLLFAALFLLVQVLPAQTSGAIYRRSGILNGNQVKTVYGNWGVIGQPSNKGPRGAWIYDTNGYIGDVSPIVGAEVTGQYEVNGVLRDTTFFWVIDCPVRRPPEGRIDVSNNGVWQAFEPLGGYINLNGATPAISANKNSWPDTWPDKMDDLNDPGWPGSWNGLFGKTPNADLETYFVMDDNADNEFTDPLENPFGIRFRANANDPNRNGMGLEVKVRGLQWAQILAQDNIFWVYEITNTSTTIYPRSVFGMLVGTYVGVTGTDDSPQEYNDDWSFFDVNEDLTYTGDFPNDNSKNPFWQGDVGLVGYAFLESPGNPFDGIDNDNDAPEGITASPFFQSADFQPVTFTNSPVPSPDQRNKIVLINKANFERTVLPFPANKDTFKIDTLGYRLTLISGVTKLSEGNIVLVNGVERVNQNSYDGRDNDLDGLIDENFYLHYRQRRVTAEGDILFDILNPVRHVDYVGGIGASDAMIDEKRDDGIDNDNDWSRNPETGEILTDDQGRFLDDVGADGIPETGDFGEYDNQPTPGEPNFDRTDKDESDQIGLSSFEYFVPAGELFRDDDNDMWSRMRPGFFDVPESYQDGRPTSGEDGDFLYSSGYFPLTAGQTERLSLSLIFGWTLEDLIKKLQTVREIYNSDYRFPIAPLKPNLRAVAGSDSVALYWDRGAEKSFDPVLREFDFEGYKIYKATDPLFTDAFTVTNSAGVTVGYDPLVQFDLVDDITGFFYPPNDIYQTLQGWGFDLGQNTGLKHSFVDYDVDEGRTYYYAVVSYDKGDEEKGIIPAECTKNITEDITGAVEFDINTLAITPKKSAAGYSGPKTQDYLPHEFGGGFGTVKYKVVDPTALTGHDYEVYFWDTSNDGLDNNGNWKLIHDVGADGIANTGDYGEGDRQPTVGEPNVDARDPKEMESITTFYGVRDYHEFNEEFRANDTNFVALTRQNLVAETVVVQDGIGNVIDQNNLEIDFENGRIRAITPGVLQAGQNYLIRYQHNPIYFSPNVNGSPWIDPIRDTDIFDGLTLSFENVWRTELDSASSGWEDESIQYTYQLAFSNLLVGGQVLKPVFFPSDYEIRISNTVVDSTTHFFGFFGGLHRKFQIYNKTLGYNIEYMHFDEVKADSLPGPNEIIYFIEKDPAGVFNVFTFSFTLITKDGYNYDFVGGEKLNLVVKFPLNKFDKFSLKTELPKIDQAAAKSDLDKINVVPNPYIVAHEFEPKLPSTQTTGRGERRIYFRNLPLESKIHIFTVRGEHLVTLDGPEDLDNGNVIWNMKTKENLDIAYGVYFYVVDSPVGKKRGKFAVIK